jgi:hypothetical protein
MRTGLLTILLVTLLAACGGGGGSSGGGIPVATPSPTPAPTATPNTSPQNYFPVNDKMAYVTGTSGGSASTSAAAIGTPLVDTACSTPVNPVFGEYLVSAATALVDYATINAYQAAHNGANPLYVVTKNTGGDVYVVGIATYGQSNTPAVSCVTPYLWVRAQMKAGDAWQYVDALGITRTANVTAFSTAQVVTVQCGTCVNNGQQKTYSNVATVVYGGSSPYTMLWAGGVGPVQTTNTATLAAAPAGVGATWTASSVILSPNSP